MNLFLFLLTFPLLRAARSSGEARGATPGYLGDERLQKGNEEVFAARHMRKLCLSSDGIFLDPKECGNSTVVEELEFLWQNLLQIACAFCI